MLRHTKLWKIFYLKIIETWPPGPPSATLFFLQHQDRVFILFSIAHFILLTYFVVRFFFAFVYKIKPKFYVIFAVAENGNNLYKNNYISQYNNASSVRTTEEKTSSRRLVGFHKLINFIYEWNIFHNLKLEELTIFMC